MFALPEWGAALLYSFDGTLQGTVYRCLPIGKLNAFAISDEGSVVQMKMVSGDFGSRVGGGALLVSQPPNWSR